jgi:hypothetical protein
MPGKNPAPEEKPDPACEACRQAGLPNEIRTLLSELEKTTGNSITISSGLFQGIEQILESIEALLTSNSVKITPEIKEDYSRLKEALRQYASRVHVALSDRAFEIKQFKDEVYPPPTL